MRLVYSAQTNDDRDGFSQARLSRSGMIKSSRGFGTEIIDDQYRSSKKCIPDGLVVEAARSR
jgi:hypothetical protein